MSEDPRQSPDGPGASEQSQKQPEVAESQQPGASSPSGAPQEQPGASIPANQPSQQSQYPPTPEVYIQPDAVTSGPGAQPRYPPAPEVYAQQPPFQPPQPQQPPRVQNPYAPPPAGYGAPAPFTPPPPFYGYGYDPFSQVRPLPLGQAIRELPTQYRRILFRPGARTFAAEQNKAEWGIIWVQILFLMVFIGIIALPVALIEKSALDAMLASSGSGAGLEIPTPVFITAVTIGAVVFAPLVFFASVGIQWLLAKAFKGTGWFKQQAYNQLLYQVPTFFVTALLYLILTPFINGFTSMLTLSTASTPNINVLALIVALLVGLVVWGIGIYSIVLNVFSIMATHRLSGGRATGVVLIPYAVAIVLYLGCVCVLTVASLSTLH